MKYFLSFGLLCIALTSFADVSFKYLETDAGTYFISFIKEGETITSRVCSKPLPAGAAPVAIYNCVGAEKTMPVTDLRKAIKNSISYGRGFGPEMRPLTELEVLALKDERTKPRRIDVFYAQRDLRELNQYIAETGIEESLLEKQKELQMLVQFEKHQASGLKKIDEETNKIILLMEDPKKLHPFVEVPIIRTGLIRIAL